MSLALLTGLSPLIGGITGLVGSIVNKHYAIKEAKQQLELRKVDNLHELAMADKEYARLVKLGEIDIDKISVASDADARQESYAVFTKSMVPEGTKLTGWRLNLAVGIDAANNSVRWVSTVYYQILLGALAGYCIYYLNKFAPSMLASDEMKLQFLSIIYAVIDMVLFLSSMSLGWFFGNKGVSKGRGKV